MVPPGTSLKSRSNQKTEKGPARVPTTLLIIAIKSPHLTFLSSHPRSSSSPAHPCALFSPGLLLERTLHEPHEVIAPQWYCYVIVCYSPTTTANSNSNNTYGSLLPFLLTVLAVPTYQSIIIYPDRRSQPPSSTGSGGGQS